jgi:thiamine pyrophosphate-dependent acetolactate synthase large subunit-like protein
MDFRDPPIDFSGLARSFGVTARRATTALELDAALDAAMAKTDGPTLIEAMVGKAT